MGPLSLQPAKTATREELKHSGVKVLLISGLCSHGSFIQDVWQPILAIFYLAQCKQRIFLINYPIKKCYSINYKKINNSKHSVAERTLIGLRARVSTPTSCSRSLCQVLRADLIWFPHLPRANDRVISWFEISASQQQVRIIVLCIQFTLKLKFLHVVRS